MRINEQVAVTLTWEEAIDLMSAVATYAALADENGDLVPATMHAAQRKIAKALYDVPDDGTEDSS